MAKLRSAALIACFCIVPLASCDDDGHPGGPNDTPKTGTLKGLVKSSAGGTLPNVTVTVTPQSGSVVQVTSTVAGAYEAPDVQGGQGTIRLSTLPPGCLVPRDTSYIMGGGATVIVDVLVTCSPPAPNRI